MMHALKPFTMRNLIFCLLLFPLLAFTQNEAMFRLDSLPKEGVLLNQGWKWHPGDNPEWAKPEFDDAQWEDIDPSKEVVQLPNISTDEPLWLRIKLNPRAAKNHALSISQSGASEIYLNGRLIQKIGQIDPSNQHTIAYNPLDDHLILKLDSLDNTLAIRYYFQPGLNLDPIYSVRCHLFSARVFDSKYLLSSRKSNFWSGFNIGFALILFFVHGVLFLYYPPLRANFWFSVWAFTSTMFSFFLFQLEINPYLERNAQYVFSSLLLSLLGSFCLLYCIYLLLENNRRVYIFLFLALGFVNIIGYYLFSYETRDILWFVTTLFQTLLTVSMAIDANRQRSQSGMPVLYGTLAYFLFWTLFITGYELSWSQISKDILFHLAVLSFPITMSALLGYRFRQVNQSMLHNLEEVNQLYIEKQQILSTQNETLEKQVLERTAELEYKNRDLEIEGALERVRSRTMAMHQSNQLADVISVLCKEILNLGIHHEQMETCYITTFKSDEPIGEIYLTTSNGDLIPDSFYAAYDEDYYFKQIFEAWKNGDSFLFLPAEGEELMKHFAFLYSCDVPPSIMEMRAADHALLPTQSFNYILYFSQGYLAVVTRIPVPEYQEVFKRFGNTLQQAYTRFLDLQKAEVQAREAQIEAALERVRSKTFAIQSSDELSTIIGLIYKEMGKLNVQLQRCFFMIFNPQNLGVTWWMASGESVDLGQGYFVQYSEHPPQLAYLKGWKERQETWRYLMQGVEKTLWDAFLFHETELSSLPPFIIDNMKAFKTIHLDASFHSFGCLTAGNEQPLNDEAFALLIRFSKVFDLTYTRFNDIKIAESQAEQAQIDLIQIQTEKKRAEDALIELRITQTQLIQSEKLASLGELTAGIAHEIQNPLNFVNNFAEVSAEMLGEMEEELDKGDTQEAKAIAADLKQNLNKINHHGQRASSIVKGMLEHSRTSTGVKEPTDLNALADEYLRLAYHGLRAKDSTFNATMETHFDESLPKVEVIPQDIGRVLLNLINNAFYAVNEKAKMGIEGYHPIVTITTNRVEKGIELKVQDNGNGIPEAIKEKIFQPFFTTKPTGQGTGLGLSLAYDIVTKGHGGTIQLETNEDFGTTFIINLPMN